MNASNSRIRHALRFEQLEARCVPAVSFDSGAGLLNVTGDEAGQFDDVIQANTVTGGFVEVTINGTLHSSDPGSANFDAALTGASATSVTSISIQGLAGSDTLAVGNGFTAAGGHITLEGGSGHDLLTGSDQAELLLGGAGRDTLSGGGGADTLRGGLSNDQLDGEAGDDLLRGGNGDDTMQGGEGTDTVMQVVDADQTLTDTSLTGRGTDSLGGIERGDLTGGAGDNRIDATSFALGGLMIAGGDGNDTLLAGQRDDTVIGGGGNDRIDGRTGADLASGGEGNDNVSNAGGADTLRGGDGDDTLTGAFGDDDLIRGGKGNDLLVVFTRGDLSPGDDSLFGGPGSDSFRIDPGTEDHVKDTGPEDTVEVVPL
jgi:Ca2+-binding RTX toxin-like protein